MKLINDLSDLKSKVKKFESVTKYSPGHNHYKEKLKTIQLEVRGFLIKLKKFKLNEKDIKEIHEILSDFLSLQKPSKKDCQNLLNNLDIRIQELELSEESADPFEERIYDKNSRFDFRVDIKDIFNKANTELFIVDSWINEDLLEVYLRDIKRNLKINVLSGNNPKGKIVKLINDYNNQYNSCLDVRESAEVHDRGIFINNSEGWVMGQSIKDGAKNKPTYLIKLRDSKKLELIYQRIWNSATKIK